MIPALLVPTHLDALYVKEGRRVLQPMADFTQLPHFNGERDVNASNAWLSEEIVAESFQDQHFFLEQGIHLHWALPQALTRAAQRENDTDRTSTFPPLPDRWLVTQGREFNGQPVIERQWVVESNYLHPENSSTKESSPGGIAFPFWTKPSRENNVTTPFRRLGRVLPLKQWLAQDRTRNEYLQPPLTAVGYGEPSFAAFYPNCYSVFGFHDPRFAVQIPEGLYYQVIGWYDDPRNDYLQILMQQARSHRQPDETSKDLMKRVLKERLGWTVGDDPPTDALIVCYARLTFRPKGDPVWTPVLDKPKVAFGATVTEALSSYLAMDIGKDEAPGADAHQQAKLKAEIEDQLEAIMLAPQLEQRQLDLTAKFMEARHAKGFVATDAGFLWAVRSKSGNEQPNEETASQDPLWPEVQAVLSKLNRLQQAYNETWNEIRDLRRQLFSDWYKYMLCAYPPSNAEADYPKISQIRFYLEHQSLPELEKRRAFAGELVAPPNPATANLPLMASSDSRDYSLARRVEQAIAAVLQNLASHQQAHPKSHYVLQRVAAPRYWRPTEPVVLLTGGMVQTDDWHERKEVLDKDGYLPCQMMTITRDKVGDVVERICQDIENSPHPRGHIWTGQPWHPFLLQWEVELTPLKHQSNLDKKTRDYDSQFVTRNYTLKRTDVGLSPKTSAPALAQGAYVYRGSSLLTPYGVSLYLDRLEDYLKQVREDETAGNGQRSPLQPATRRRLEQALAKLKSDQFFCLAQSLSGFNDALLMHKQTLQLPIDDPIGFAEYRQFASRVRDAVGDQIFSAPQPFDDFSPIRNGELRIKRLRLISTFGRIKDFECHDCCSATPMPARERKEQATHAAHAAIMLPPRLVQPARLHFRWLAADQSEQEMNSHPDTTPICGWALANYLDQSLFFYDGTGEALGYLETDDSTRVRWRSAPGRREPIIQLHQIKNGSLRQLISFLLGSPKDYFNQFLTDLENAQMKIHPEQVGEALLMGQPLALVRASLNLELQGLPAAHQGWNEFRRNMTRRWAETNRFTHVRFPFRLGEQDQLNDGLTVYWLEDGAGGYQENAYIIPNYDEAVANPEDKKCDFLYQSVDAPPLKVTMLIDPRGVVHATTGILPTKEIQIPPHQYAAALQCIEMSFLAAPLLVDKRSADGHPEISLPVADPPGYHWTWIEKHGKDWLSLPINARSLYAPFATATEIREGWLKLTRNPSQDEKNSQGDGRA